MQYKWIVWMMKIENWVREKATNHKKESRSVKFVSYLYFVYVGSE